MAVFYVELQVEGHVASLDALDFLLEQPIDYGGRPNGDVRVRPIKLTISSQALVLAFFANWGKESCQRHSGRLVFYSAQGQVLKVINFLDAYCIRYNDALHPNVQGPAALTLTLWLSPAAADYQGQQVENHSVLPWPAKPATRRRAATLSSPYAASPRYRRRYSRYHAPRGSGSAADAGCR